MAVVVVAVLEAFDRLERVFFLPDDGLLRVRGSIASSGDMDPEAARFSRSSRRRFNFLPASRPWWLARSFPARVDHSTNKLTVVALSNAILNATTFCQIRDLGPVFIGVGIGTESTAGAVVRRPPVVVRVR